MRENDCIRRRNYRDAEDLPWMHENRIQRSDGDQVVSDDPPPAVQHDDAKALRVRTIPVRRFDLRAPKSDDFLRRIRQRIVHAAFAERHNFELPWSQTPTAARGAIFKRLG